MNLYHWPYCSVLTTEYTTPTQVIVAANSIEEARSIAVMKIMEDWTAHHPHLVAELVEVLKEDLSKEPDIHGLVTALIIPGDS